MIGPRTEFERRICDCVESHGCFVMTVGPEDGGEAGPRWSYSIGFTQTFRLPEVVLYGLPGDLGFQLVNDLAAMCRDGLRLADHVAVDNLVQGFRCIARSVDESWLIQSCFASALWFHRTQMQSALTDVVQIVWPDPEGLYPWEPGCADWVRADQPELYKPRLAA